MAKKKRKEPWERAPPAKAKHTRLSSTQKQTAKRRAKRAGRPYPNLVDNMSVASARKTAGSRAKKAQGR